MASASPRRRELLDRLGLFDLTVLPARSEADYPAALPPAAAVTEIARCKAADVAARVGAALPVLAADTVVSLDGRILEKPVDEADAFRMLRALSGRSHTVYTGMALRQGERELCDCASAEVRFRSLSDAEIRAYIATGGPMDKAGAYGAQDLAALFVERIEGEFYTVVGLPLCRLGRLLHEFGLPVLA